MKIRPHLLAIFLLTLLVASPVTAQRMTQQTYQEIGLPRFDINAISLLSEEPGETRIIAYIEIPYQNLQFVRSVRGYEANYEVDLSILAGPDNSSPRVAHEIWRSTVIVSTFEETNARERFDISEETITLAPGKYTMVARITDLETRKQSSVTSSLEVPSYGLGGLSMSDLLLAREIEKTETDAYEIVPNVDRVIGGEEENLNVYYEVYPHRADSLSIYLRMLNRRGGIVHEIRKSIPATQPVTRDYIVIPADKLKAGPHVVELEVSSDGQSALRAAEFDVRPLGLPRSVENLDMAIRQLRYIARNRLIDRMLSAPPADRRTLFNDFWTSKDPTPDTPDNPLMYEYYRRIAEANRTFGGMREGWETDRGEVYIRYGPPDEIERHPFEVDSRPYEIWYYYDGQKRFIFVDELGYGEYRLVSNLWQ